VGEREERKNKKETKKDEELQRTNMALKELYSVTS
jgi:hypothetical protein